MEFNPNNNIVKLCLLGMGMAEKGKTDEAGKLFRKAWNEAANDFEKFIAAHFVAVHQNNAGEKLHWFETALQFVLKVQGEAIKSVLPSLYMSISKCYEELNDTDNAKKNNELAVSFTKKPSDRGPFYHGTRADLHAGDLLTAGGSSNYNPGVTMNHIYFTALVNGAGLAAELAQGAGRPRVYLVEPTGSFENDPNVTDKKFPGNLTRSYRSLAPLKIAGEVTDWIRLTPGELNKWRERLANSKGDIIN